MQILSEGAITPLITLLGKESNNAAKASAAGALLALSSGQPETQKAVVEAGAIRPLVALLDASRWADRAASDRLDSERLLIASCLLRIPSF